ncbi:MAG: AMP-binding protein, partial [bacterium]|nr:AMP-binding protein [bacterium]
HADLLAIIGIFVNTLAIKNYPIGEKTIKQFLGEVRNGVLKALENQEYPFENLVGKVTGEIARDTGRNPLFDVMFSMQETEITAAEIPGLKLIPYQFENPASKFDMTFICKPVNETLNFSVEYSTNLFKPGTIQRIITYFKKLLLAILHDPGATIAQLEIVPEEEKRQILDEFNNTAAPYPKNKTIHEMFEEQAKKTPDQLAVINAEIPDTTGKKQNPLPSRLTYRELDDAAGNLADRLRKRGVTPGTIVGIMVERSVEMIAAVMAILKAGGAYLPIEPTYPEERIRYLLKDSNLKVLLTRETYIHNTVDTALTLNLDEEHLYSEETDTPKETKNTATSNDPAYVIYTSGSTGNPKGVLIEHHAAINRLNW